MNNVSRYWADWTTRDLAMLQENGKLAQTIAILPVAATEQHGPHLPLRVDTALVDGVVNASLPHLAPEVPALFLPTQALGLSPEHAAFAGTLSLKADTVIRLWTDIGESVAASGVRKMVLLNAHGGQVGVMDIVARDLRARLGMLVYSVNWFGLPLVDPQGHDVNALFSAQEHRFGIHAGDIETSMMLALAPAQVHMAQAQNFSSAAEDRSRRFEILGNGRSARLGWQMQDYNAHGAVGNAANATAEKGRAMVAAAGRALAALLTEIHHLPADTLKTSIAT
ncbi:MAG: creatininase family protein [Rhodoferax sp.]|nr:creatininase family protein [Rhodoferax sp.]MCF8210666.1 creatininase family protein [Rhodoferax sp.]